MRSLTGRPDPHNLSLISSRAFLREFANLSGLGHNGPGRIPCTPSRLHASTNWSRWHMKVVVFMWQIWYGLACNYHIFKPLLIRCHVQWDNYQSRIHTIISLVTISIQIDPLRSALSTVTFSNVLVSSNCCHEPYPISNTTQAHCQLKGHCKTCALTITQSSWKYMIRTCLEPLVSMVSPYFSNLDKYPAKASTGICELLPPFGTLGRSPQRRHICITNTGIQAADNMTDPTSGLPGAMFK